MAETVGTAIDADCFAALNRVIERLEFAGAAASVKRSNRASARSKIKCPQMIIDLL